MELKVLLADDDALVCECLKSFVPWKELGCELIGCAPNGKIAYEMAEKHLPDIIITDIKMPHMDGTDLCIKIKGEHPDIKIVFLSAYESFETAKIAIRYNVQDYILKPINHEKIAEISEILRLNSKEKKGRAWIEAFLSSKNDELIKEKIAECDGEYFLDVFCCIKNANISSEMVRMVYRKILQITYDYFEAMGIDKEVLKNSREKNTDFIENCKNVEQIAEKLENIIKNLIQTGSAVRENDISLADEIVKIIDERFFEVGFSVSTLGAALHYSADYISRVFREKTGISTVNYIMEKKVELAKKLLRETELSVRSISQRTGFTSDNYFIKAFKKATRMTPAEFRIYHREAMKNLNEKGVVNNEKRSD